MSAAVEARRLISDIAGPMPAGAQIQEMLSAVARETGLGARRLRGIWNNEARSIRAEEIDAFRDAARRRREAADRDEYRTLVERIDLLEKRLETIASQPTGSSLDRGRETSGAMGGVDRPLA